MEQKQMNAHINRTITTSHKMFESNFNDDIPALKEEGSIIESSERRRETHQ